MYDQKFRQQAISNLNAMVELVSPDSRAIWKELHDTLFPKQPDSDKVIAHPVMLAAVSQLHGNYVYAKATSSRSHDEFVSSMKAFQNALHKVNNFASEKHVKEYLIRTTFGGHEVQVFDSEFLKHSYLGVFLGIRRLIAQVDAFLDTGKRKPRQAELGCFVRLCRVVGPPIYKALWKTVQNFETSRTNFR